MEGKSGWQIAGRKVNGMLTSEDWESMYKAQQEDFRKMRAEIVRLRVELAKSEGKKTPQANRHESEKRLPWIE